LNVYSLSKVYLHLADFPKNFTVDLTKEELALTHYPVQLSGPIINSDGKYIELPQGIYMTDETVGLDSQPKTRKLLRMSDKTRTHFELNLLAEGS